MDSEHLKNVIQMPNPQLALIISSGISEQQIKQILNVFSTHGFKTQHLKYPNNTSQAIILSISDVKILYDAAEKLAIKKPENLQNCKMQQKFPKKLSSLGNIMSERTIKVQLQDLNIIKYLQKERFMKQCYPLHHENIIVKANTEEIENYYGENIAIYFMFADFYYKWLKYAAIVGLFAYYLDSIQFTQITVFSYAYSIFFMMWITLLCIYWQRKESEISLKWGTFGHKIYRTDNFVAKDLEKLKEIFLTLFITDEIRKIITETLIPLYLKRSSTNKIKAKRQIEESKDSSQLLQSKLAELDLWEYDDFDDYIEVIFQIVHISFFAALIPLASTMSFISNYIENFSDKYKGIGNWKFVLNLISVFSILTNLLVIGYSSYQYKHDSTEGQQKIQILKTLRNIYQSQHKDIKIDSSAEDECIEDQIIVGIFCIEHIVIITIAILRISIKSVPKWVAIYQERQQLQSKYLL